MVYFLFSEGVLMGSDTGSISVSIGTEKSCFSLISLDPLGDQLITKGFIILKPRPTRRTLFGRKRIHRTRELTDWVCPTSQVAPDGLIGRFLLGAPFNSPPNRLGGCETFVEFKTLASLAMTPNARAQQVQAGTEKRAHDLDLKYPGSAFT